MHRPELSRAERARLRSLHQRKARDTKGLFLAEGVRVVEELVASPLVLRTAVVTPELGATRRGAELRAALAERCRLHEVSERELAELSATEAPQGVLVAAETPRASLDSRTIDSRTAILVLDAIQDPGNVGALLRTAEALGATAVVALPGTADPWNPKAVRAAAGTAFRIPIVQVDVEGWIDWAHRNGLAVYGAEADGEAVDRIEPERPLALIVGNEGAGLRDELRDSVTDFVSVPIRGRAESLNVAVAAGILLYLLNR